MCDGHLCDRGRRGARALNIDVTAATLDRVTPATAEAARPRDELWSGAWASDRANLSATPPPGVDVDVIQAAAEQLVSEHWDRILIVAATLARRGRLDAAEIELMLR